MTSDCHYHKPCDLCKAIEFTILFYRYTGDLDTALQLAAVYYPAADGEKVRSAVTGQW
ncbi:MAG: hypothetical protein ACYDCO_01945 [Armatimonadota bacterium]